MRVAEPQPTTQTRDGSGGQPTLPWDVTPPQSGGLRWQGEVPHQKWMNFYTKVLSRLVSKADLKLQVRFELPAGSEASTDLEETRTALRELGLSEDLEQT